MDKYNLLFSLGCWGEFGMRRFQAVLNPGEKRTIPITVPVGRYYVVTKIRFGDITADTINFRFDNCRGYFEQDILIGTELLNFPTEPEQYIVISGTGKMVIQNTDNVTRNFSIVLDFILMDNEIMGKLREMIYADREIFRGMITKQAGTGGA